MKQHHQIRAALLALCLLLTACGAPQGGQSVQPAQTSAYTADILPCALPLSELTAVCAGGENLYLAGKEETAEEAEETGGETSGAFSYSSTGGDGGFTFYSGGTGRPVLYRMDASTGEAVKLEGYAPAGGDEDTRITSIVPGEDGSLWVLEESGGGLSGLDLENMDPGAIMDLAGLGASTRLWRRLDADGAGELDRWDVTDLAQKLGVDEVTVTLMDGAGRLYAASGASVTVLEPSGKILFTCQGQEPISRLTALAGGGVGAVTDGEGGSTLLPVDPEARSWGDPCPLTGSVSGVYAGDGEYAFLYSSGDSLYGWPQDSSVPKKLLSWSGTGLDCGQVASMQLLPEGGAALLRDDTVWPASYSLARFSPADEDALAGRTVLTLATLGLDSETRTRVLEFNRTNSQARIEIRDYSELNTPGDASAGLSKLNTEILAGNMPDLLDISAAISLRQYAARGLLEDLWPYIESDPELGREGVMERVLKAAETGGKLYRIFPRFTIETAAGAASAVGDRMGWTLEELRGALAGQPAGCDILGANETRASIFETMFANNLDKFVDWEKGEARFDSPAFREILDFCAGFPAQADGGAEEDANTRVARGEQLLMPVYLTDFTSVQLYRSLFGGEVSFVGYPGQGSAGVSFGAEGGLAMSAACKDKEAAWSFMRQTLLPSGEDFFTAFPVNRADFDRFARESMEVNYLLDENGQQILDADGQPMVEVQGFWISDGQMFSMEPATQADYDQVMALYEAADTMAGRDENIWAIAQECAGAYFAGDRTAEEASRNLQRRVELYLNEQK